MIRGYGLVQEESVRQGCERFNRPVLKKSSVAQRSIVLAIGTESVQ
jgi:hypothetical protein